MRLHQFNYRTSEDEYGWKAYPEDADLFNFVQGNGKTKENAIADLVRELSVLIHCISPFLCGAESPGFVFIEVPSNYD